MIINSNKYEWETLNTPKLKVVYSQNLFAQDFGTIVRIKCHQPIKRKEKTLQDELCTNWESIDNFGVQLDLNGSICHADGCKKFYEDPWIDYANGKLWWSPPFRNERFLMYNRPLDEQKGFILKNGNFERFEPIGVTWNDSYCRRITDSGPSGCFVKRDLSTILNFNFQENNCSGRYLIVYLD